MTKNINLQCRRWNSYDYYPVSFVWRMDFQAPLYPLQSKLYLRRTHKYRFVQSIVELTQSDTLPGPINMKTRNLIKYTMKRRQGSNQGKTKRVFMT